MDDLNRRISVALEELTLESVMRLKVFVAKPEVTSVEIGAARVLGSILASYAKLTQAEGARQALGAMLARELAEDKAQLRNYVRLSMPSSSPLRRMLGGKTSDA